MDCGVSSLVVQLRFGLRAGMPLVPKAPSVQEIKDRAAQATAAVSSTASAVAGAAVAAVAEATAPPPPPRERWTFSLCGSCAEQPGFASYACVAPCFATAEISSYRSSGNPEAKADTCALMCNLAACWLCDDGLMASERERVREKTNMIPGECCNAACWDTCLATMFCWGCAAAQMKRELQVWFGHAGEGAPVHPGSSAAKRG